MYSSITFTGDIFLHFFSEYFNALSASSFVKSANLKLFQVSQVDLDTISIAMISDTANVP